MSQENTEKLEQIIKEVDELIAYHQDGNPHRFKGDQFINHIESLLKDIEEQILHYSSFKTTHDEMTRRKEYLAQAREVVNDILKTVMLKAIIDPSEIIKERLAKQFQKKEVNSFYTLSTEEQEYLTNWMIRVQTKEMAQVQDMIENCNISFQFAKTHSTLLKDWEKTKKESEEKLKNGILPPGSSANLYRAIIDATNEIMRWKLQMIRDAFEKKFSESIYNYLGPDGKTKKLFGIFG